MKLESLKETKFKDAVLKKEQMFTLNGGGTVTPGGHGCGTGTSASNPTAVLEYDYGYDADRVGADGKIFRTYHNRTNVRVITAAECEALINGN